MTPYEFAVMNVQTYIRSSENQFALNSTGRAMNAWDAAQVIAVAFMKDQNEVLTHLLFKEF